MIGFDFDITVPAKRSTYDASEITEFPLMASKFFPLVLGDAISALRQRTVNRCLAKNVGAKFTSSHVTEKDIEGIRIWRTE